MALTLQGLAKCSEQLAGTRKRLEKIALLADLLRHGTEGDVAVGTHFLVGTLAQGKIGVGFNQLSKLEVEPAQAPSLTVLAVDAALTELAACGGKGSVARRLDLLYALFARATAPEQDFLRRLVVGELRQGALEGLMVDAIAIAFDCDRALVQRGAMLTGDLPLVAKSALTGGERALADFRLEIMTPVQSMLASPADSIESALVLLESAQLEYKLDGARVQIHRDAGKVAIYSRRLNDVTQNLPEIVDQALGFNASRFIVDGEVIGLHNGKALPFQKTMARFAKRNPDRSVPLSLFLFDCLHVGGEDLIDCSLASRREALEQLAPSVLIPMLRTSSATEAAGFVREALAAGHEGAMAKAPASRYVAGSRGKDWLKIKPNHSLDLVVLGAEWGSGRRKGFLSNLHLGARDETTGEFVMLGKTFKGLTDKTLAWQTEALLARETAREGHAVLVRPELVVEIAFNNVQASSRYPGGMALRFARVKGYRPDKRVEDADTLAAVKRIFEQE